MKHKVSRISYFPTFGAFFILDSSFAGAILRLPCIKCGFHIHLGSNSFPDQRWAGMEPIQIKTLRAAKAIRLDPVIDAALGRARAEKPLVHCLSNSLARNLMANVVLALGASPSMVSDEEEVIAFAPLVDALVINLASLTRPLCSAMRHAAQMAAGKPWLLDPAAVGRLPLRTDLARDLLDLRPSIVKGNASEIVTLAGGDSHHRCADSALPPEEAIDAAAALAQRIGGAVIVSGPRDYVTDGVETLRIEGGHSLMACVTGMGCSLGAAVGAFLGAGLDPLRAAAAAAAVYAHAGEKAGEEAAGPGSFVPCFLDRLFHMGNGT
jgi:hydroxyethylthiazole kinase